MVNEEAHDYSDVPGEANSVLDLMFLQFGSPELDSHHISPENWLSSDHAPLSIEIPIIEEIFPMLKFMIPPKSDHEKAFIDEVISNFKSLNTNDMDDVVKLDHCCRLKTLELVKRLNLV